MMTLIMGLLTKGFDFWGEYRKEKAAQIDYKLQTERKIVETTQNIRLENASADVKNTSERIKQMAKSWKDEFTMLIFYAPFITNLISPFVDLYFAMKDGLYQQGMLAQASLTAIQSLNEFPIWYVLIVVLMTLWSWGASKEVINKFVDMFTSMFNFRK